MLIGILAVAWLHDWLHGQPHCPMSISPGDQKCTYYTTWTVVSLLTWCVWARLCDRDNISVSTWQILIWSFDSKLKWPLLPPMMGHSSVIRNFVISGTHFQSYNKVVSEESFGTTPWTGYWSEESCYSVGLGMTYRLKNPYPCFVWSSFSNEYYLISHFVENAFIHICIHKQFRLKGNL